MKYLLLLIGSFLLLACSEKPKAIVHIDKTLTLPVSCMKLNTIGVEDEFVETLRSLYTFDSGCHYYLTVSYKKDIVCNSSYNSVAKSTGKFPKSFLKLELREGMNVKYSYYIDLLDNVESDDLHAGFERLKKDLLQHKAP